MLSGFLFTSRVNSDILLCYFISYPELAEVLDHNQHNLQKLRDIALYKLTIMNMELKVFDSIMEEIVKQIKQNTVVNKEFTRRKSFRRQRIDKLFKTTIQTYFENRDQGQDDLNFQSLRRVSSPRMKAMQNNMLNHMTRAARSSFMTRIEDFDPNKLNLRGESKHNIQSPEPDAPQDEISEEEMSGEEQEEGWESSSGLDKFIPDEVNQAIILPTFSCKNARILEPEPEHMFALVKNSFSGSKETSDAHAQSVSKFVTHSNTNRLQNKIEMSSIRPSKNSIKIIQTRMSDFPSDGKSMGPERPNQSASNLAPNISPGANLDRASNKPNRKKNMTSQSPTSYSQFLSPQRSSMDIAIKKDLFKKKVFNLNEKLELVPGETPKNTVTEKVASSARTKPKGAKLDFKHKRTKKSGNDFFGGKAEEELLIRSIGREGSQDGGELLEGSHSKSGGSESESQSSYKGGLPYFREDDDSDDFGNDREESKLDETIKIKFSEPSRQYNVKEDEKSLKKIINFDVDVPSPLTSQAANLSTSENQVDLLEVKPMKGDDQVLISSKRQRKRSKSHNNRDVGLGSYRVSSSRGYDNEENSNAGLNYGLFAQKGRETHQKEEIEEPRPTNTARQIEGMLSNYFTVDIQRIRQMLFAKKLTVNQAPQRQEFQECLVDYLFTKNIHDMEVDREKSPDSTIRGGILDWEHRNDESNLDQSKEEFRAEWLYHDNEDSICSTYFPTDCFSTPKASPEDLRLQNAPALGSSQISGSQRLISDRISPSVGSEKATLEEKIHFLKVI